MHSVEEQLSALDGAVGILQIQRTRPDGLDLCAEKLDPGLIFVLHEVVVDGLAVLCRDFDSLLLRGVRLLASRKVLLVYHGFSRSSSESLPWQRILPVI